MGIGALLLYDTNFVTKIPVICHYGKLICQHCIDPDSEQSKAHTHTHLSGTVGETLKAEVKAQPVISLLSRTMFPEWPK